eukprot:TRINITY_DN43737_c0_g1_i1.p1 TRINITY_DN43737_c0_g1~~TRINITY_DN43737_c0_g1_i1.p1  ORF type:complete len:291 (-),score=68.35 TRINITY_DN43737_c0_g1_i1:64-936(-)
MMMMRLNSPLLRVRFPLRPAVFTARPRARFYSTAPNVDAPEGGAPSWTPGPLPPPNKWELLEDSLTTLRKARDWANLRQALRQAVEMVEQDEQAGETFHPFFKPSLFQELAQAHYNLKEYHDALATNEEALRCFDGKDRVKEMEATEFNGVITVALGQPEDAMKFFQEVLDWADGDAKKGTPIEQNAALALKRSTKVAMARALLQLNRNQEAFDALSTTLVENASANDFLLTFQNLWLLGKAFIGLGDMSGAVNAYEKAVAWCEKHNRTEELKLAQKQLADTRECASKSA